ncbi:MAG: hypothetical protein OCD01_14360 [Fibrobacterales bacterium]
MKLSFIVVFLLCTSAFATNYVFTVKPLGVLVASSMGGNDLVMPARVGAFYIQTQSVMVGVEPINVFGKYGGFGVAGSVLFFDDASDNFAIGTMFALYRLYDSVTVPEVFFRLQWATDRDSPFFVGFDIDLGIGLSSVQNSSSGSFYTGEDTFSGTENMEHTVGLTLRLGLEFGFVIQ